ncbi:MAG: aminoglycoside phosphotransferase family protein, partial [Anaerolineae bacterium]|nr:aminoglycoside phosphotransferase family protein [Anaerolineae bacterium]
MLEKPDLPDEKIINCLQDAYRLHAAHIVFLPLGADINTAVYRVETGDERAYFVKLRSGPFDEISVALPKFFADQGIQQIIAPLASVTGQLWAILDAFKVMVYPFVDGRDGYDVVLSNLQWRDFGAALKRIHATEASSWLINSVQRETYSP